MITIAGSVMGKDSQSGGVLEVRDGAGLFRAVTCVLPGAFHKPQQHLGVSGGG
jgi:hypothetical protein